MGRRERRLRGFPGRVDHKIMKNTSATIKGDLLKGRAEEDLQKLRCGNRKLPAPGQALGVEQTGGFHRAPSLFRRWGPWSCRSARWPSSFPFAQRELLVKSWPATIQLSQVNPIATQQYHVFKMRKEQQNIPMGGKKGITNIS